MEASLRLAVRALHVVQLPNVDVNVNVNVNVKVNVLCSPQSVLLTYPALCCRHPPAGPWWHACPLHEVSASLFPTSLPSSRLHDEGRHVLRLETRLNEPEQAPCCTKHNSQ